jgi:hypothetical protein
VIKKMKKQEYNLNTPKDGAYYISSIVTQLAYGTFSGTVPDVIYTPDVNYNGSDRNFFREEDKS